MFGKFSEQMKKTAQPAASLFEMNAKTFKLVTKQQTELFSGVMSDSVKLMSALSSQTELRDMLAAQAVYAESVKERVNSASKTTYTELNDLCGEVTDLVKNSLESVSEEAKAAFEKAKLTPFNVVAAVNAPAEKAAPAKKTAVKKAEVKAAPVAKPATKAAAKKKPAPKAAVKPAAKAVVAEKPAAKAVAAEKPVAKAVVAEKPAAPEKVVAKAEVKPAAKPAVKAEPKVAAPKVVKTESEANAETAPAVKASPKSVAKLSPADVKAAGKK